MTTEIPNQIRAEIASLISSDNSPVGIDAKETHIIIIHKLMQIEDRLGAIESKLKN